ncbi:expressed unknown protein [Seminavis robusta]|uniref:Uncharacterized protein n=1 Tax=Seminavis robusta TaxID=568900 RepID=A0A9N8E5S8_9STRA|nr:expressed unknown protein [Seminavis robusta]|eukprot:Sro650_g181310.1 n/a (109) ;mRNA; r:4111-4437
MTAEAATEEGCPAMSQSHEGTVGARRSRRAGRTTASDAKNTRIARLKRSSTLDGEQMPQSWRNRKLREQTKTAAEEGDATEEPAGEGGSPEDLFKTKGRPALNRSVTN